MKRLAVLLLLAAAATLRSPAAEMILDLTTTPVGQVPDGWRSLLAGEGSIGDWRVVLDTPTQLPTGAAPGAVSGFQKPVLAQVSGDPTEERFPLLVYDRESIGDFTLKLRFKTVAGTRERMAGVAFRLQDTNNFYVVRASSLGNSFRFYRVYQGRRDPPIGPSIAIPSGAWHELEIQATGNRFRFRLDGQEPIPELSDSTFREGRIALWTKSDSVSHFADLRLHYTPRVNLAAQLVTDTMTRYPRIRDLRIYARSAARPALHVVAASNPSTLKLPAGTAEEEVVATRVPQAGKGKKVYVATLPLLDVNGDAMGAVRFEFERGSGMNDATAVARARPIVREMERRISSPAELTE